MKLIFFGLFLVVNVLALGQNNPDSIARAIEQAVSDEDRVKLLNSAANTLKDADLKKSFEYATQAYDLASQTADQNGLAQALLNLGRYYTRLGRHETAMENYLKALEIGQQQSDEKLVGQTYKVIGNGYYFKDDSEMALHYYKRALAVNEKINDEETTADLQNNIALVFTNSSKLDSALDYLLKSVSTYEKLKKAGKLANALLNIGEVKDKNEQYDQAIEYYKRALVIDRSLGLRLQEGYALNNIAASFRLMTNFKESRVYCEQAYTIASEENFHPLLLEVYNNLYMLTKAERNFALALTYHEKIQQMKDSVFNEQKNRQIEELRTKYESEQKEKENSMLQAEAQLNERQLFLTRSALFLIVVVTLVVAILAFSYYKSLMRNKKAKEELIILNAQIHEQKGKIMAQARELTQANHEISAINENLESLVKEKSSKILEQNEKLIEYSFHNSHRVRGPLARILGLIGLVKNGMTKQEEINYVLNEINSASQELDSVVKEINESLHGVIKDASPDK